MTGGIDHREVGNRPCWASRVADRRVGFFRNGGGLDMGVRYGSCNLCEAMCGLEFTVEAGTIVGVRGDKADPLSRGHICPKATALVDIDDDPDRLRTPVKRIGDRWVPITWTEAYRMVADGLVGVRERHGADAVGLYWGNPMAHSLGALTHGVGVLGPMLGTRNRFSATSLDSLPHFVINRLLYGHQLMAPIPDIDRTDFFLVLGANPMVSNGSMMTVPDFAARARALRARGGRMVVVDPRRTETADAADAHLFVRPGTDALLLLALVRTIVRERTARCASYVDGITAVEVLVDAFTPEAVAPFVGIASNEIRSLARDFADARSAVAYGRMGVSTQRHGVLCQWAIHVLNIVTGNLDRVGGALFASPAADLITTRSMERGELGRWTSRVRGLPEFGGELPSAALVDEMTTPGDGRIRALAVMAGNPVLSTPGGDRLEKALPELEFMVAFDFYVNETTRYADVILPPVSAVRRDHYDLFHHHFSVRNTSKFSPAILPTPAGEKQDWEIFRDLGLEYRRRQQGSVRRSISPAHWVEVARLRMTPVRSLDLLLRVSGRGLSVGRLRRSPHGVDLGALRPRLPGALKTRRRRISLVHKVITDQMLALRRSMETSSPPAADELLLIGRRHLRSNNSWMHNSGRLVKGRERHQLLMHPDDLDSRGLGDGDSVDIVSASGSLTIDVAASDRMMPGVVSIPHGYGHQRDGVRLSVATTQRGPSANDLTDPSVTDAIAATAVFNGVPVRVSRR